MDSHPNRPPDPPALAQTLAALVQARRHLGPRHLREPGPDRASLERLLTAAAAAPDHQRLQPWRFLVLGAAARDRLGQAFADALRERDPAATDAQCADARDKALRGPVLLLAVLDLRADEPKVPPLERAVSLGCAMQNLLLAAQAEGFASGLSSGRALASQALRRAFGLAEGEHVVCSITLGTAGRAAAPRERPPLDRVAQWL